MKALRGRPWWGVKKGLAMGVMMLIYAGIRTGMTGFPPPIIIVTFLLGGAIGGFLFGVCLPYTRSRLGAAVVGILVMTPFCVALATIDSLVPGEEALGWGAYVYTAIFVGGLAGLVVQGLESGELKWW